LPNKPEAAVVAGLLRLLSMLPAGWDVASPPKMEGVFC